MNPILETYVIMIKEVVVPTLSVIMVFLVTYVAYRKKLFSDLTRIGDESKPHIPTIYGDGNTIYVSPSELQRQLAYDPAKFDEYHQQSISQSRISFWFSLFFASLGFLIIGTSVFTYSDKSGYLGIVAGTIIDVVAALFFYQSNKARQLMSEFFDKLRSDRKLEESLKLCEAIDNPLMRNSLRVRLSLFFSGLESGDAAATEILRLATIDSAAPVSPATATQARQQQTHEESSQSAT